LNHLSDLITCWRDVFVGGDVSTGGAGAGGDTTGELQPAGLQLVELQLQEGATPGGDDVPVAVMMLRSYRWS